MTAISKGRDLFIVDNSVAGWTALRYLEEWCGIARAFDIATGYFLFAAPVDATRQGKTVLVQLRDATDPESGERYTVKRYESEKAQVGDSWRHEKITLKPVNPDFKPIILTGADEGELRVIAELVEVLGGEA